MIWGRCSRPRGWVALGCWLLVNSSGGLWAIKGAPTTESEVVEYLEGIRTRAEGLDFLQFEKHFRQKKAPNQEEFLPNRDTTITYLMLVRSDGNQLMPCEEWITTYLYLEHERKPNTEKKQRNFNLRSLFERLELINNNKLRNISFLENEHPFLLNYYVDKIQAIQALVDAYKKGRYDAWLNQPTEDGPQGEASPTKAVTQPLSEKEGFDGSQGDEQRAPETGQYNLKNKTPITDSETGPNLSDSCDAQVAAILQNVDDCFEGLRQLFKSDDWKEVFGGIAIPENLLQPMADSKKTENKNLQEEPESRGSLQDSRVADEKLHQGSDSQSEDEEFEEEEEAEEFEEEESEFEEEDYLPSKALLTAAGATGLLPGSGLSSTGSKRSSLAVGGNTPILTEISTNKEKNDDKKKESKKPDQQ